MSSRSPRGVLGSLTMVDSLPAMRRRQNEKIRRVVRVNYSVQPSLQRAFFALASLASLRRAHLEQVSRSSGSSVAKQLTSHESMTSRWGLRRWRGVRLGALRAAPVGSPKPARSRQAQTSKRPARGGHARTSAAGAGTCRLSGPLVMVKVMALGLWSEGRDWRRSRMRYPPAPGPPCLGGHHEALVGVRHGGATGMVELTPAAALAAAPRGRRLLLLVGRGLGLLLNGQTWPSSAGRT